MMNRPENIKEFLDALTGLDVKAIALEERSLIVLRMIKADAVRLRRTLGLDKKGASHD
jgi:hypothetical protein